MSQQILYKVLPKQVWEQAVAAGQFGGSGIDLEDGFIHLSAAHQVVETVAKHFAGIEDLLMVSITDEALGESLRWETSRGGDLFPHVYGAFSTDSVLRVDPLPLGSDGRHVFPEPFSG